MEGSGCREQGVGFRLRGECPRIDVGVGVFDVEFFLVRVQSSGSSVS